MHLIKYKATEKHFHKILFFSAAIDYNGVRFPVNFAFIYYSMRSSEIPHGAISDNLMNA